jgi:hypothetical protein
MVHDTTLRVHPGSYSDREGAAMSGTKQTPDIATQHGICHVTIAILIGVVAGQTGAILAVLSGRPVAAAVMTGALAFTGGVGLVITVLRFARSQD